MERAASAKAAKAQAEAAYAASFSLGYAHAAEPRRKTSRGSLPPRPHKARTAAARPQAARPPLPPPLPPSPPPPPTPPLYNPVLPAAAAIYAVWAAPLVDEHSSSAVEAALAASAGAGEGAADDTALLEDLPPVGLAGALSGIDWEVRRHLASPNQVSPYRGSL